MKKFGKYKIVEKIGSGGMAEIYKATLSGIDGFEKLVVIKKILPGYANNTSFIKMLVHEAKLSSLLNHANIVQVYELGEVDKQYYIAMEYVHGKDLLKIFSKCSKSKTKIPLPLILFIIKEVAAALDFAHNATDLKGQALGIIHRDVSPSNIIITYNGNVKIMDFGVAKAKTMSGDKTRVGVLKGKIGYMSPEQVMGKELDRRSDIFSLGILLYEGIVLKRLFLGKTDLETLLNIRDVKIDKKFAIHSKEIPPKIEMIIRKALAKNRNERFQSAGEIHDALNDYLFEQQIKVSETNLAHFMDSLFDKDDPIIPESFLQEEDEEESNETHKNVSSKAKKSSLNNIVRQTSKFNVNSAQFQIKGPGGETFGPVSFENLVKMLKAGAVSAEELISVNEGSWKESKNLSIIKSLQEISQPVPSHNALYTDTFRKLTLPRLFFKLYKKKINGRLVFKHDIKSKTVFMKNQRFISVTSNLKKELLGSFLLSRRVIDQHQLEDAIAYSRDKNIKLGGAFIALKYLKGSELSLLIELLVQEKVQEIFTWFSGEYKFYENDSPDKNVILTSVPILKVITASIRRHYNLNDFKKYFKNLLNAKLVFAINPKITPREIGLNARELKLIKHISGYSTLSNVIKEKITKEDLLPFLRIVFLYLESNILEIVD